MNMRMTHAMVSETLQSNVWWNHDSLSGVGQGGGKGERTHLVGDHGEGVYAVFLDLHSFVCVFVGLM